MSMQIYGMSVQLTLDNGSFLNFTKTEPWLAEDINPLEKKMLINYPISRILPLQIHELDLQISLRYKLGTKKSLSESLLYTNINEMDCLRLLFAIASTIVESKSCMLNEERYLLHESFIYIGADYTDVHLIYLPLHCVADKPPLQKELLLLTNHLFKMIRKTSAQNSQKILHSLHASEFVPADFKKILYQMIMQTENESLLLSTLETGENVKQAVVQPEIHVVNTPKWSLFVKHNPVLATCCLFSIMLIWGMFMFVPSIGMFNCCLGLSILTLILCFKLNQSIRKMETGELATHFSAGQPAEYIQPFPPAADYYEQLSQQTTCLNPKQIQNDATVLLVPQAHAYLEVILNDALDIIELSADSFIIGRNTETAHYAVNWIGLSRNHLEIQRKGNCFDVRDLGSKNGSKLNEEVMIPHQAYQLNNGDCLKVVEKQLIFKIH